MYQLTSTNVFADSGGDALWGVSDLTLLQTGSALQLYAVDRVSGRILTYEVLDGATPTLEAARTIGGGSLPSSGLDLIDTPDGVHAVLTGMSVSDFSAYRVQNAGNFSTAIDFTPASGFYSAITSAASANTAQGSFVITAQYGQTGLTVQTLGSDLAVGFHQNIDTGGTVADVAITKPGDNNIVLVSDATGQTVQSYRMNPDGTLTLVDALTATDGLAVYLQGQIDVVTLDGVQYGILAASGTSSLSVFRIADDGALTLTDHVFDGLATRFAGASEVSIVLAEERAFVLAAGSDDGITLLELLPDGRLYHHGSVEDQLGIPLQNVSGLVGTLDGNKLQVFVSSEAEAGIGQLEFTLGATGDVITGGTAGDTLNGTGGHDVLWGGEGGNDHLIGGNGDDILVAGAGDDSLTGGSGEDVFVLGGATDKVRILDFDHTKDVIDLSGWSFLYQASQLEVTALSVRYIISWGDVNVSVYYPDTPGLTEEQLLAAIKIDLNHSVVTITPPDPNEVVSFFGTSGDDELIGDVTIDMFFASAGADLLDGGENTDSITFEGFSESVKLDLLFPDRNAGELSDDVLISIEGVVGTEMGDTISGDHGRNYFDAGAGDDFLRGRSDRDLLRGEDGNDTLDGGKGRDRLEGNTGHDSLEGMRGQDHLRGGQGNDVLRGGEDADYLLGGKGRDALYGGNQSDRLNGGYGDDTLTGGSDADLFIFGASHGDDVITDFNANNGNEKIDLTEMGAINGFNDLMNNHTTATVDGVLINTGEGTILLEAVGVADLSADDFLL